MKKLVVDITLGLALGLVIALQIIPAFFVGLLTGYIKPKEAWGWCKEDRFTGIIAGTVVKMGLVDIPE